MPAHPGNCYNPNGRPKGSMNKDTRQVREAFQRLLELNTENMIEWLTRVAADNPAKALEICGNLAEYVVPRLARTELTGADGEAIRAEFSVSDQILAEMSTEQLERVRQKALTLENDGTGEPAAEPVGS